MSLRTWIVEKLNPAQSVIRDEEGDKDSHPSYISLTRSYNDIESVNRGVNLIVNGATSFNFSITDKLAGITPMVPGVRKSKVFNLLNHQPNPFQDIDQFRSAVYADLVLEGNAFIYYDGAFLYVLPASNMTVVPDPKAFVKKYTYSNITDFKPDEIIHISDNSSTSIYRGTSRLQSTITTLKTRSEMVNFQQNFFKNGAVPGLVVKSPNVLGDKVKERLLEAWARLYNPSKGGKRPIILDGGLEVDKISDVNFQQLDFENSIQNKDELILLALGVPSILLYGGNNANISPNLRLFYLETVLPLVRKMTSGFERYFGYNLEPESSKVSALQPDLKENSAYFSTLVNGGILTPNEARVELRRDPLPGHDDLRIPANIAGSAADPSKGGKPKEGDT